MNIGNPNNMKSQALNVIMQNGFDKKYASKSLRLVLLTVCLSKVQDCFNFNRIYLQSDIDLTIEKGL